MENKTIVINKIFSKENMLHLWNKIKNRFTDTEKKMNMIKVFMEKYYASPSGTATYTATISEWNGMSKYELIGKSFVGVISDTTPFPTSNELIIRVNDNVYNVVTTGGRQITSFDGYNLSNPMMFIFKTPDTLELKDGTDIGNINGLLSVLPNNMVGAINTTYNHAQKVENDVKSINNKRLESMEEINLTTEEGFYVGALAIKELTKDYIVEQGKQLISGTNRYNYYEKYASGKLVQWGIASYSYTDGFGRITYPIPFTGNKEDYMLFVQGRYMSGKVVEIMVASKNTVSQGYAYSLYTDNSRPDTHNFDWYAVGRWK